MDKDQFWIEGYKARGEACKQGGVVSVILMAIISSLIKQNFISEGNYLFYSIVSLALAVVFSALAYLIMGVAVTRAAEKGQIEITVLSKKAMVLIATIIGVMEIIALLLGISLFIIALTKNESCFA